MFKTIITASAVALAAPVFAKSMKAPEHLSATIAQNIGRSIMATSACDAYAKVINPTMLAAAVQMVTKDPTLESAMIEGANDFKKSFEFAPRMTCDALALDMPAIWRSR